VSVTVTFLGNAATYPKALASLGWPGKDLKTGSYLFKGYIPEENPRQNIRTAGNPLGPTALRYTNIFGIYSSIIIIIIISLVTGLFFLVILLNQQ
jgi:hypothetical protein